MEENANSQDWKLDPRTHKRYRKIGNTIEYETEVTVGGVTIPQSQLVDFNRRELERKQKENEERNRRATEEKALFCPLFASRMHSTCIKGECAFYTETGCQMSKSEPRATQGKKCPISNRKCNTDCALFKQGCTY